ncbi:MAG: DinB family protein [Aggregatilineales bacterium]
MNADAFRHLYDYHFSESRKVWDEHIVPLDQDKFVQEIAYSVGSIRNHIVHMMSVDDSWFHDVRGLPAPDFLNAEEFTEKDKIRAHWDGVEQRMRAFLADLTDEMLFSQPLLPLNNDPMTVWQMLIQVVNHGTDHRAQLLMHLHNFGAKTSGQDYVFFVEENR